ncbi:MAG: carboxypeptidase regulatory-like domain-containing protein [Acidobacteria bacterium]|nr:carboxypeptidase regulatory-like domain-containing protein [Acidobacteriota bacterium]
MLRRILFTVWLTSLLAITGFAQQAGQIVGAVTDNRGEAVPGVTVKAVEVGTGFVRTAVTGSDGRYVLPAMRPTKYEVTVEASGFRSFRHSGLELLANQSLTLNIVLEVGTVTETVNVVGGAVQVDTSTATLSEVVDRSRIVELPLNGRDAARLSTLVAGTMIDTVSTETGKSIPGGLRLSSNGSQARQVAFKLDGVSNTDFYFQENQTFPFPDALQEFSIQTSNYSAAQGNNAGAVVNVVTRSGTNEFHGGAFEFARNRVFNARNFFARGRDFLKRNQFGAFGGGPVLLPGYDGRNKTFFFLGWQGTRIRNRANDVTAFAPTIAQRSGDFSSLLSGPNPVYLRDPLLSGNCSAADRTACFPNNQIPTSRFDPATVNVLKFIPAVGGDGRIVFGRNITQNMDQGVAKVDHKLTEKDQLSGRYFIDHFDNGSIYNDDNLLTYRGGSNQSRVRTQNVASSWTRTISPRILNEFSFGYNRIHSRRAPPSGTPSMKDLGVRLPLYPTLASIAQIEAVNFFNIGDNLEAAFVRNGFEFSNRTSWVTGRHSIQFGGEIARYKVDINNEFRRAGHFVFRGNVTGNAIADLMLGRLDSFDQGTGEYKNNRATYPGLFFQDDFKVHQRLTLNLGMRYEPTPPWHEVEGRIQYFTIDNFRNGVRSPQFKNAPPGVLFRGDPGVPEDGALGDNNNVAGRFGFAWDVFGDGKTSVRGGAGMFYDQHLLGEFNNGGVNAPPWSIRVSVTRPQGPFSDPYQGRNDFNLITLDAIGDPNAPFPRPVLLTTYDGQHTTPLTYNWNLTLEREIFSQWLVRAAYVGSASNYGRVVKQLNAARPGPGSTDSRRLFAPEIGNVDYFTEDRRSYYHSLQLSMNKRLSQGFTLLANYTLSKALGNYSSSAGEAIEVAPWFVEGADKLVYGPTDFDHRHRLVVSWVWDLPKVSTDNPFLKGVLHGWQVTGIGQYQSGGPYTISSGRDNSQTGINRDRAKLTGVSPEKPAGSDKTVWFNPAAFAVNDVGTFGSVGRGAFYGPSLFNFDMGFFKGFRITEQVNIQFRAEMFNIFNQVNFNLPNRSVTGGGFGTITSTHPNAGDPRIIQFGLKLVF